MRRFLLKVLLFCAFVVAMDFAFGYVFSWLRTHAKGGSTANCEYIANRCVDDVIILGSSRATHHYIPQIIEDSLGVSCYNCGEEGNGVVLACGRLKMLMHRYKPKLVIYEITPGYDYGNSETNKKFLGYLRAYYDKQGVRELFDLFDDEQSWLKMKSKMYQNTTRLLPDIVDNMIFRDNNKGYDPLYGKMKFTKTSPAKEKTPMTIDSLKLSTLESVIVLCKKENVPLVFMVSPWCNYDEGMAMWEPAFRLCEQYGIEVYNHINDPDITQNNELFQDNNHLNDEGAKAFTLSIIPLIKKHIQ